MTSEQKALANLLDAVEGVLQYTWDDNDEDATEAINRLSAANEELGVVQRLAQQPATQSSKEQVDTDWMEAACPLCSQRLGSHIAGKVPGCPPQERLYVCKGCGHVTGQGLEWCPDCRKDRMPAEEVERGLLQMPDGNCFVRVPTPIIREIEELRAFRRAHETKARPVECPYCKRPRQPDGSVWHEGWCVGLEQVSMNRLRYDALRGLETGCPDPYCNLPADHEGDHDDTPSFAGKATEARWPHPQCPICGQWHKQGECPLIPPRNGEGKP